MNANVTWKFVEVPFFGVILYQVACGMLLRLVLMLYTIYQPAAFATSSFSKRAEHTSSPYQCVSSPS